MNGVVPMKIFPVSVKHEGVQIEGAAIVVPPSMSDGVWVALEAYSDEPGLVRKSIVDVKTMKQSEPSTDEEHAAVDDATVTMFVVHLSLHMSTKYDKWSYVGDNFNAQSPQARMDYLMWARALETPAEA